MTLPELRACLERLHVNLSIAGDKLVVDAPAGVLSTVLILRPGANDTPPLPN